MVFILITLLGLAAFFGHCTYRLDVQAWHGGLCPGCHGSLRRVNRDNQGGTSWTCRVCGYYTYISWPWLLRLRRQMRPS